MAKIRKIYDEAIKPDGNKTVIYPITSTRAVYSPTNVSLDSLLNEGYRFGGVVSPSDVPLGYTQRAFYGTSEPGTYSSFGGLIVEPGEAAFLMYDGNNWTKKLFSKTGSNITGFKVLDNISDLPTTPSTLGYLISDSNSMQSLYVWVGEGGDTYFGMYTNCGRLTGESAYETAVRKGYQGSEEQWLESLNGEDGVSILDISYDVDEVTHNTIAIFTLSDGTTTSIPIQDGLSKSQIAANTEAITSLNSEVSNVSNTVATHTTNISDLTKQASTNIILDPNGPFFNQIVQHSDVVYEIRDSFDLDGMQITLPPCTLYFNGGKIYNGELDAKLATLVVNDLQQVFDDINFTTYFSNSELIPEYFGAVGNGTTDDTEALRMCIKASYNGGAVLHIPNERKYLVTGPINYYDGKYNKVILNIKGDLPDRRSGYSLIDYGGIIVADGASLFQFLSGTTSDNMEILGSISNVSFIGTRNLETKFFNYCNLHSLNMKYCNVGNFGAFCYDTSIKTLSNIRDNNFVSVFYFSRAVNRNYISLVDSTIYGNYINGGMEQNDNACFQFGEYNGSVIHDNFIDYYRTIYEVKNSGSSNITGGHINAYGNHYQVFRYLYYKVGSVSSFALNSQHEYINWTNPNSLDKLGQYTPITYTGRDSNSYDLPPYIFRTTGSADNIVIEDIVLEKNIGNVLMYHGAPTQYSGARQKFTISNWSDSFGTLYALPEGTTAGCYCGGNFQHKEVETNFVCTVDSLPTISTGWSSYPYGAKVLYDGQIYKDVKIYTTSWVVRWTPVTDAVFFPDYEDFTATSSMKLKLRDRDASNGMGYKILRTDKTFASQVTLTNTIYEVRYDFDLGGATITIPSNCSIIFEGGSFSNGSIVGDDTKLQLSNNCFTGITVSGTWNVPYINVKAFSDIEDENVLKQAFALCNEGVHNIVEMESDLTCLVSIAIDEGIALSIPANTEFILNGTIQLKANAFPRYRILSVTSTHDIYIHGSGKVWGDFEKGHEYPEVHVGLTDYSTHEWGRGLAIFGSKNVTVDGIEVGYCTGDAISITPRSDVYPENVVLKNIYAHTARRQGITVSNVNNLLVENYVIENIRGTEPGSAIDVEPNVGGTNNIVFRNGIIKNCRQGAAVTKPMSGGKYDSIVFENLRAENMDKFGVSVSNGDASPVKGTPVPVCLIGFSFKGSFGQPVIQAGNAGRINISGLTDMNEYDESNPSGYPDCVFYLTKGTGTLDTSVPYIHATHVYTRCANLYVMYDGEFTLSDSLVVKYSGTGTGWVGTSRFGRTHINNCTLTGIGYRIFGRDVCVENSTINSTTLTYITDNYPVGDCTVVLRNNRITLTGNERTDSNPHVRGISISSQNASNTIYGKFEDNKISFTAEQGQSGETTVVRLEDARSYVDCINNEISAPNLTNMYLFNSSRDNKWSNISKGLKRGTTDNRPTLISSSTTWISIDKGYQYFDTTLGKPIWWAGTKWVYADGSDA